MNSLVPPEMCYSRPVISRRFRDLRESQGKTQRDIAEGGGFPRSQLQLLERGSNVTLTTLQKAVSQLDGMRVDIIPAGLDVEQIRSAALELREIGTQLTAVSDRLLHAVGSGPAPAPAPAEGRLPGGGGATRHEAGVDPSLVRRLEAMLEREERGSGEDDEH